MIKVDGGYFITDEEYGRINETIDDARVSLALMEEIRKLTDSIREDVKEMRAGYVQMNACMDRIEGITQ